VKLKCCLPGQMELLQGTLDLRMVKTLALESRHGWAIAQRIHPMSRDLTSGPGPLYPALHRGELQGSISSEWGASETNRRAQYYALTRSGRKQLEKPLQDWNRLCSAIGLVLQES
jgi:PadR family transcriptional regulator PadR